MRKLAFVLLLRRASTLMLRRAAAALLLILSASPFTAPFATCDVLTLFGNHTTAAPCQVHSPHATADDHSQALALLWASRRERMRHDKSTTPASAFPAVEVPAPARVTSGFGIAFAATTTPALTSRTPLRI